MKYNVISSDGHIDLRWLPPDFFTSAAPASWRDRVPQRIETEQGKRWYAQGRDLVEASQPGIFRTIANSQLPTRGASKRFDRMHDAGFYDGLPHPITPELRLKDQDLDGVDAEVIYGILGMGNLLGKGDLVRVVYQIYNTWVANFCKANPQRLVALACIPNDDPESAAAELRRTAKLGLGGADFNVSTAVKPIWHRDWDPLWAAAEECNMPISFHATGVPVRMPSDEQMALDYAAPYRGTWLTMLQIAGGEFLSAIVFSGALERFPGMKFVLGECGVSWVPYVLARMDEEYDDQFRHLNFSMMPSDYWRRQGYTTFQHETILADVVPMVGQDNVMWGSDYPHADGVWPDSRQIIEADLGSMDPEARGKITCHNAGKLYGLIE